MWPKPFKELSRTFAILGIDLEPGVDEGTDQPCPNRTLMVGSITRVQVSVIAGLLVWLFRRERAEADWRQKLLPGRGNNSCPPGRIEHRVIQ
jgi:hypothetical protein